jgi:hypothetical protein
MRKGE